MAVLNILKYPNPVLLKKATMVKAVDEAIKELVRDMIETMIVNDGVGLAAPQVDHPIRLFLAAPQGGKKDVYVFINPLITSRSGTQCGPEGCLSVPGVYGDVERAKTVTVTYTDLDGKRQEIKAEGFLARIIQHENDHLNGKVFIDQLGFTDRKEVLDEYQRMQHISL